MAEQNAQQAQQRQALTQALKRAQRPLIVTGAGVSVASGITPFRKDKDAHWERNLTQLATRHYFEQAPEQSWAWYLSRFQGTSEAQPNPAHLALAQLEELMTAEGKDVTLVTQNIDGLHREAGSNNLIEVHGSAHFVRCSREGRCELASPGGLIPKSEVSFERFSQTERAEDLPRCPQCQGLIRPHVLWFDEYYNEHERYQFEAALTAAERADLVLFIGTSFSVGITAMIERQAQQQGASFWVIEPSPSPGELDRFQLLIEPSELALPKITKAYELMSL